MNDGFGLVVEEDAGERDDVGEGCTCRNDLRLKLSSGVRPLLSPRSFPLAPPFVALSAEAFDSVFDHENRDFFFSFSRSAPCEKLAASVTIDVGDIVKSASSINGKGFDDGTVLSGLNSGLPGLVLGNDRVEAPPPNAIPSFGGAIFGMSESEIAPANEGRDRDGGRGKEGVESSSVDDFTDCPERSFFLPNNRNLLLDPEPGGV